jgi:phosphatidylserine synthase
MAGGALYSGIFNDKLNQFNYTIPFIFIIEGLVLSVLISVLYGVFFSDIQIKKWRFFPRLVLFSLSLLILLALCVLVFFAAPTDWAKLWWIAIGCVALGIVLLSIIAELHFRKTGKRYTEILKNYQTGIS